MHREAKKRQQLMESKQKEQEQEDLEMSREDWIATNAAKERERERARMSLAGRNEKGRLDRVLEEQLQREKHDALMEELRLRKEEAEDVNNARREEFKRTRESLCMRLETWRQHRQLEEEQAAERRRQEGEDWQLAEQDREALKEHERKKKERDRKSHEFRVNAYKLAREEAEITQALMRQQAEADRELSEQDRAAVQEYKAEQEAKRRTSLAFRR
jgi:fused signal recognition particle receptor